MTYFYSSERRIWERPETSAWVYSDGERSEDHILATLKGATDLRCASLELRDAIRDWPSEYHLGPLRHNLLRTFSFTASDTVLELGCGCGGITRYLGELGTDVTAVEGSPRRARIAAERCRDLPNVSVYCDNLVRFETNNTFDFVLLVGVLEYAPVFISGEDPVGTCLRLARAHLAESGILVLAIENQLGLKYFNGCAEDHTGVPFFGLNGRYGRGSPVTFGRNELLGRLRDAGFVQVRCFYPFPDYKLAKVVLSDDALRSRAVSVEDLLCMTESRDYSGSSYRMFREARVWPLLARNELVADLANSFLVLAAGPGGIPESFCNRSVLATTYSAERHPSFATETRIIAENDGSVRVTKTRLFPAAAPPPESGMAVAHRPQSGVYHHGRLLLAEFQDLMAEGGDLIALSDCLRPWLDLLRSRATSAGDSAARLPGDYLDCGPRNLVRTPAGNLDFFDAEWVTQHAVPFAWIAARGLVDCIANSLVPAKMAGMTVLAISEQLAAACGLDMQPDDWQQMEELENAFQAHVLGRPPSPSPAESLCNRPETEMPYLARIRDLEHEIDRIKSTLSWQVTKPLRLLANLPRLASRAVGSLRQDRRRGNRP
jgi:SAM-dependent methyltransferase